MDLYESYLSIYEDYSEKNDPKNLQKELPKGFSYGSAKRNKGDHTSRTMKVNGMDTDMQIGGAEKGAKKFSSSFRKQHTRHKNTLSGIDREVSRIRSSKTPATQTATKSKTDRRLNTDGKVARKARGILRGMKYEHSEEIDMLWDAYLEMYESMKISSMGKSMSFKVQPGMKEKPSTRKQPMKPDTMKKLDKMASRGSENERKIAQKKQRGPSLPDFN